MDGLIRSDVDVLQMRVDDLEAKVISQTEEINLLRADIDNIKKHLLLPQHVLSQTSPNTEFENLSFLLHSEEWPKAVNPALICNLDSEKDKEERAESIVDLMIDVPLENMNFLDFGCGDGHVVNFTQRQKPKMSIGFDIAASPTWETFEPAPNIKFTADWSVVEAHAPYNAVLVYDVLDHIGGHFDETINALMRIKKLTIPGSTRFYVRCHPWCSRHGTHLYRKLNKAYVHIVFTPEELNAMGLDNWYGQKIIHPNLNYEHIFRRAGFHHIRRMNLVTEGVERFFQDTPLVANRIKAHWRVSHMKHIRSGRRMPLKQMAIQFIDYLLL